jgi:hypothetical protein
LSWHAYLEALDEEKTLSLVQIARSRVMILMVTSLVTWLMFHLLSAGLQYGLGWPLTPWIVGGVAWMLSCGMLGRVVAGMGVLRRFPVVYLQPTDNSSRSRCGKMSLFHPREGGLHHDIQPVVLPTPAGRSRVGLPHHPCLVARPSQERPATAY